MPPTERPVGRDGATGGYDSGDDHDHTDGDDHDDADGGHESGGGKGPNYMGGLAAGGRLDRLRGDVFIHCSDDSGFVAVRS